MNEDGSVTHWIRQLREGDAGAQQQIWNRYFSQLTGIARQRLSDLPRRAEDEEDVVLSALDSFFRRTQQGQFPLLHDRTSLWPLLLRITIRKAWRAIERHDAQKRGGRRVRGDSVFAGRPGGLASIEDVLGTEPTPDTVVALQESLQQLINCLDEAPLRQIADRKLQGYSNGEIAQECGVSKRTIERKLRRIRVLWQEVSES